MVHVDCCHCCYGGWRERDGNDYWIQLTHRDTVGVHSYSDKHKAHQHTQPREPTSTKTQKLCKTTTIDLEREYSIIQMDGYGIHVYYTNERGRGRRLVGEGEPERR